MRSVAHYHGSPRMIDRAFLGRGLLIGCLSLFALQAPVAVEEAGAVAPPQTGGESVSYFQLKDGTKLMFSDTEGMIEHFGAERLSLRPLTKRLRAVRPGAVPLSLIQEVKEKLQRSAKAHDCVYKRSNCIGKTDYFTEDVSELLGSITALRIAAASPELVAHLTTPNSESAMFMDRKPPNLEQKAVGGLASFGAGTVPLVLEKMRAELKYDDDGTNMYWYSAMYLFIELYDDGAVFKVERLIEKEKDPVMRRALEKRILMPLEQFINGRKRVEAARQRRQERLRPVQNPLENANRPGG